MPHDDHPLLRIGHSPDPDDAFMWWPLLSVDGAPPGIDTGRFRFEAEAADIESLNRRSEEADLPITALSCAQYPYVADRYALTACGASLGDGYGPKLVAREAMTPETLRDRVGPAGRGAGRVVAVPGERTSAFGALSLMLGPGSFLYEVVPFERIIERVVRGEFEAGLVIHEGQLTYEGEGLVLVADVGAWWSGRRGLPLPLGVNAIRRDLESLHGPGALDEVASTLRRSVQHALAHRDRSLAYALRFARGMDPAAADVFVRMYVNRWTLDFEERGREAVRVFLRELHEAGLVPDPSALEIVGGGPAAP